MYFCLILLCCVDCQGCVDRALRVKGIAIHRIFCQWNVCRSCQVGPRMFGVAVGTVCFAYFLWECVYSCILFVPVDVIKERLQVQAITVTTGSSVGVGGYRGSWDALRTIVRTEGIGRGLYRGFGITLFSFGPFSALYFSFYESLKGLYLKGRTGVTPSSGGGEASLPFLASLMLSATAGSAASLVTNPLDLVKLRIQIERRASAGTKAEVSGGVLAMLGRIWSTEGLVGLFRGAGARILFHAPNTAITMALFETCRTWWNRVLE